MASDISKLLKPYIRTFPDFPKKDILFYDLMPLFYSVEARSHLLDHLMKNYDASEFDVVAGIDARGFVLATMMAEVWKKPLVLFRKRGKLPGPVHHVEYHLEYAFASLEIQQDAFNKGDKILLVDDLIATGGTLAAALQLIEKAEAQVFKIVALMELQKLNGREHLGDHQVDSIILE